MNKNINKIKILSSSSSSSVSKQQQQQQPWINKAIIGTLVAIQIIVPTISFNPSLSLADSIPLIGTKAPDFSLPSNEGIIL